MNKNKNINYFIVYDNFFFRNKSNPKILDSEKKLNNRKIYTIKNFDFSVSKCLW